MDLRELAGTFQIRVRAKAGVDLDDVKAGIDEALARFEKDGFLDKDLARIKAEAETGLYNSISSVLGKAFQLAQYGTFAGDPGYVTKEIERIQSVTRQDVLDVYDRYVKGKHYVMTSFVPQGGDALIVTGAKKADVQEEQVVQGAEKSVPVDPDFEYAKTEASFDRSIEPDLGPSPLLTPPEIWTAETDNGMRVLGIEHRELPLVRITLRLRGGQLLDPPGKTGAASLLADLMNEGTANRTPEELEDAIGELGASISVYGGREGIGVVANGLARNYDALVNLMQEILLEPRWDEKEFDRLKSAQLTRIRQREGNPRSIAQDAFGKVVYGEEHVFALPASGTSETAEAITLDDLKAYYERNFSPSVAAFHVAGAIDRSTVVDSLQGLGKDWPVKEVSYPEYALPESPPKPVVYFIDVPGSKQSVIVAGRLALSGTDEKYNDLVYANDRLGSGSSARLFQLLRIEKGYTYGAGSYIPRQIEVAPFVVSTSVRANVTLESLQLIKEQLRDYRATFTQEDLDTTKNLRIKQATQDFETLGDLIGVLTDISEFDLPLDFVQRDQQELSALTLEQVHATIDKYMDESRMVYVVVGDGATQLARVKDLGYGEPRLLDVRGEPIVRLAAGPG